MKRNKSFNNSQPLLYLVATPIGNLSEMSKRAIEVLSEMDIIAAEDTRNTKLLLKNYGIEKDYFSLREHNENEASEHLIKLLKEGKKIAYVSDAGYPGISDPGYLLVCNAIKADISVSTVCGSSAFLNALVASGLPTNHFYFYGFLSAKESEAKAELEDIKNRKETVIFYEAPHRIIKTLTILRSVLGNRDVVLARELTKLNEEFIRGKLDELVTIDESTLKGEMVVIVKGNDTEKIIDDESIINRLNYFTSKGLTNKDAIEIVCDEMDLNKNYVKKLALK